MSRSSQSPELRVWPPAVLGYLGRRGRGAPARRTAGTQPRPPKPVQEGGQRLRHGQDSAAGRRCSGLAGTGQPSGLTALRPFPAGSAPLPPLESRHAHRVPVGDGCIDRRALTIVTARRVPHFTWLFLGRTPSPAACAPPHVT